MRTRPLKRYFVTGLLIWVPLVITVWVISFLIGTLDGVLDLLPERYRPDAWLGTHIPGLGAIVVLAVILLTGMVTANYFGRQLLALWENLLARIPVVKSIYSSVKQVSDTLFSGQGEAFRKVLLVRYPHPDAWSLAFQTNVPAQVRAALGEDYVGVFIPTTPSPVNGFYFYVRKSETCDVSISVDLALKYIVSMGAVATPTREKAATYPGN
ncbi:DUF502 domain-containing protein [Thiobacter aerophilum]|uniref:DUF502 domain-containing protein n=1 Tax=Thiobacter aerophilum TaxID=3121275 RepID=A0ABV0EFH5_9BURK